MFGTFLIAVLIIFILYALLIPEPKPIAGVYSQPGKWYHLKYWIFYVLLALRRRQNARKRKVSGQDAGWGMRSRSTIEDMEKAQQLPDCEVHPLAVDAVYFSGASADGTFLVAATARRQNNLVQTVLYIRIPGLGLLELPSFPDTSLYTTKPLSFSAGGLEITPVTPMKTWKLKFQGDLRLVADPSTSDDHEEVRVSVTFDLDWRAYTQYFDFDTDLHPKAVCRAMAHEKWTRKFFDSLQVAHQTHYEQFGEITGAIHISSHGAHEVALQGVRDHSYGNIRDWADLHRYGFQYIHVEDGSAICIGQICMPRTLSRLLVGYVMKSDGTMKAVSSTTFELHQLGEDGISPKDFEFTFHADDEEYHLKGHVLDSPIFYYGDNWEAIIHERFCHFEINGKKGWGISEWDYRHRGGKPESYKKKTNKSL